MGSRLILGYNSRNKEDLRIVLMVNDGKRENVSGVID